MSKTLSRNMLIVENEAVIAAMTSKFFSGRGYTVTVARNYAEFQTVKGKSYDVAIVDFSLEGALNRDGLKVVTELKAKDRSMMVLMFTALQTPEIATAAKAAGADEVVLKPSALFKIDQLIEAWRAS